MKKKIMKKINTIKMFGRDKIIKIKKKVTVADILMICAFLILFFTTLDLNVHIAFYLLSSILGFVSWMRYKQKGGEKK